MGNIRIDADAAAALAELDKLARANEKLGDGLDGLADKSKANAAEERRLGNLRNKLLRETDTAQESLKRRIEDVTEALKGTGVSEERLGRIRDKLHADYEADLAKERRQLGGIDDKLDDVGKANRKAFGTKAISGFKKAGGGLLATLTALAAAAREIRQEIEQAADAQLDTGVSAGQLVQLAGGDPVKRDKLLKSANATFVDGFVENQQQAYQLTRELASAEKLDERRFFSRLSLIDDSAAIAKAVGLVETGFAGGDDTGTSADVVSKFIAGALPATGVSPSQIAEGTATAAGSAKSFGLTDEELIAAISRVAQVRGSGSEAGSQVRQFFTGLTRQGLADELAGQGLPAILDAVAERATTEKELVEFLGSVEAKGAFEVLIDRRALLGRLAEVLDAQESQLANRTIRNAMGSDLITAGVDRRSGEAQRVLSRDSQAIEQNRYLAERGVVEAELRNRGFSEFEIFGTQTLQRAGRIAGDVAGFFQGSPADQEAQTRTSREQADGIRELVEESKRQTEAIRQLKPGIPVR